MEIHNEFYRETWVEIDLDAIAHNVRELKNRLPAETHIIAVVKADGYGHGAFQVATAALEAGASMLAVAFLDEGLSLRRQGVTAPILNLGVTPSTHLPIAAENDITVTIYEKTTLEHVFPLLQNKGLSLKVHIKYDSGMGRLGSRSIQEVLEIIQSIDGEIIQFEGLYTHFATADELDKRYLQVQAQRFQKLLESLEKKPPLVHCSNSAATFRFPELFFNGVRLGIGMYGLTPSTEIIPHIPYQLKPAMSLHARMAQVKQVEKGSKIGYGATYTTTANEWIGTLPIGYADGWPRKLSGQTVLINGMRVPLVGRICMDQSMVRLPYSEPCGTKVTLIGESNGERITVEEIAEKLETINYEVICGISPRIPKVFIKNGQEIDIVNKV